MHAKKPEDSRGHADILSGATQHGIQGIPEGAFEPIPEQLAFNSPVTDRGLNGTAPIKGFLDRRCSAALLAATPDRHAFDADAAIALVDEHCLQFLNG